MQLSKEHTKHLISLAHSRKPVVRVGQNGLTDNIVTELENALVAHELVKIKLAGSDQAGRKNMIAEFESRCTCQCIQQIGHTATVFRRNTKKPVIIFP